MKEDPVSGGCWVHAQSGSGSRTPKWIDSRSLCLLHRSSCGKGRVLFPGSTEEVQAGVGTAIMERGLQEKVDTAALACESNKLGPMLCFLSGDKAPV